MRRKVLPRTRRHRFSLVAGAALVVTTLIALPNGGMASSLPLTITAPYHGSDWSSNTSYASGCGAIVSNRSHSLAHSYQGTIALSNGGNASNCYAGPGTNANQPYLSAGSGGSVTIALPASPNGSSHVVANLSGKIRESVYLSDGTGKRAPTCAPKAVTDLTNYTAWAWGWNGRGFRGMAYLSSSLRGTNWTNYSSNLAAVPSPFMKNGSTAYYHNESFARGGDCRATVNAWFSLSASLQDRTVGASYTPTNSPPVFYLYVLGDVHHIVDWGWNNASSWNGPGANWSWGNFSRPTTIWSTNVSKFAAYSYCQDASGCQVGGGSGTCTPAPPCSSGGLATHLGWTRFVLLENLSGGSFSWNLSLHPRHHYVLEIALGFWGDATNNLPYGFARFSQSAKVSLASVTIR